MKELTYQIQQNDYLHIIEYPMRERMATPWARLKQLVLTWGQTGVVAVAILTVGMPVRNKLLLAALSLLLLIMTLAYSKAYRFKSKFLLSGLLRIGQVSPSFFGTHTLRREGRDLVVSYGSEGEREKASAITHIDDDETFFYLRRNDGSIFEAVPRAACASYDTLLHILFSDAQALR